MVEFLISKSLGLMSLLPPGRNLMSLGPRGAQDLYSRQEHCRLISDDKWVQRACGVVTKSLPSMREGALSSVLSTAPFGGGERGGAVDKTVEH